MVVQGAKERVGLYVMVIIILFIVCSSRDALFHIEQKLGSTEIEEVIE